MMDIDFQTGLNKGPKACTTCAKAKARCVPGPSVAGRCERCHRLGRECMSRAPAPPRPRRKPKRSKVAELEQRLDQLSSQFDTRPQTSDGPSSAQPKRNVESWELPLNFNHLFPHMGPVPNTDSKHEHRGEPPMSPDWSGTTEVLPRRSIESPWPNAHDSLWPPADEAEILLKLYVEIYAHMCPFVVLRPGTTAADLKRERPWVWKGVMLTVTFFDGARNLKLGRELLGDIVKLTMLEGTKSLDVLQALQLVIVGFNYAIKGTQLTHLLFLARSMCVILQSTTELGGQTKGENEQQSLEHLRAYAGTYYINTLVFTTNKKTDVFMSTTRLDACCRKLEAAMQYPSDIFLVKLVQVQQLAQSISLAMSNDAGQATTGVPLTMVVQSFEKQIEMFRHSLPNGVRDSPMIIGHMSVAELLLKEVALSDQHCNATKMPHGDRLQLLKSCVRSLRTFVDVRLEDNPVIETPRFLCLIAMSDLAYTVLTAMKLMMLNLPGWDLDQICDEVRIGDRLQTQVVELVGIIEKRKSPIFEPTGAPTVSSRQGGWEEEDPFVGVLRLLNNVTDLLRMEMEGKKMKRAPGVITPGHDPGVPGELMMGDLGEDWWGELINDTIWDVNGDGAAWSMDWT